MLYYVPPSKGSANYGLRPLILNVASMADCNERHSTHKATKALVKQEVNFVERGETKITKTDSKI
jgi:hypothetical protein